MFPALADLDGEVVTMPQITGAPIEAKFFRDLRGSLQDAGTLAIASCDHDDLLLRSIATRPKEVRRCGSH